MSFKRILGAALCAAVVALTAPQARGADATPYDINVILSMSGPFTFVGKTDAEALRVLQETVNKQGGIRGRPIRFVIGDDQTNPQVAVQLLNDILQKHPSIVLGSSSAASCQAMAPLVSSKGPVEYCLSPAIHPPRGSYVFASSVSTRDCMFALIRYFREKGLKRIALITSNDVGGLDADNNVTAAMQLPENSTVQLVSHEHFNVSDVTATAQLARMRAAQPQAALLWGTGTAFATLIRGAAEVGFDVPIATSNAVMNYAQLSQYTSILPKELLFPGLPFLAEQAPTKQAQEVQRQFFDAFTAAKIRPDFIYSTAWDPAVIAISALRSLGPDATPDQIRNYIGNLHGFNGIAGSYDFRTGQTGLTESNIMIMRWDPAKVTWTAVSKLGGTPLR